MANQVEILQLDINTTALIAKMTATRTEIDKIKAAQKELSDTNQKSSDAYTQNEVALRRLQTSYNQQRNVVTQLSSATTDFASTTEAMTSALGKEIKSIDAATENNKQLKIIRNSLNATTEEGAAAIAEINKKLDANTDFIKENASAAEQQKMAIGGYKDQIKEAFSEMNIFNGGLSGFISRSKEAGGVMPLLKKGLTDVTTGISGMVKESLAFVATPIGAVVVGLAAAFAGAKAVFDFNKGLQESNKELLALGVNAKEVSKVRSELTATADVFDKEFKDIAAKANSLAKSYGISISEANKIIAEGLANGGAQNAEFLDSIGEYDVMFAKAGYSAQEFVNIVNTGYELGIYADKLPDALKEADLALKEQGKATKDALINAFGAPFTSEILSRVKTGELTTKDALETIAAKAKETGLSQQQQAQLTADLFKGAGEDAGGAGVIFDAVNKASTKGLSETAKTQLELVAATEKLNKVQAELFEIADFGDTWTTIKTYAIDALSSIISLVSDVKKGIQPVIDIVGIGLGSAFQTLKAIVGVTFEAIAINFRVIGNVIGTFFNFFKAIVKGDFTGAINAIKNGFINMGTIIEGTFGKMKNTVINSIKGILDNFSPLLKAVGVDVDSLQKKLTGLKSKEVNIKSTSETSSTASAPKQDITTTKTGDGGVAEAKKIADAKQAIVEAGIVKNKEALALFVAEQGFRKKTQEESLAFEEQITQKKIAILDAELAAKKISQTQYDAQKLTLSNDLLKKQADAAVINADKELADFNSKNKTLLDGKKYLNDELVALEIDRLNKVSEAEAAAATAKLVAGQLSTTEYNDAIKVIDDTYAAGKVATEAARVEAKKATDATNLENQRIIDVENLTAQSDIDSFNLKTKYDAEIAAANKNGADKTLITQKYTQAQKKIDEGLQQSKIAAAGATFGVVADLLGKETAAGKAAALAQALINTYLGITAGIKLGYPMAIPAVALAAATGFAAVKNITATKVPTRAEGGEIPTLRSGIINNGSNLAVPLSNGDDTLAYVGQGEMILNKEQQRKAGGPKFFQSIGVPSYATGGYVSQSSSFTNQKSFSIDYNQLAKSIATANMSLPAPVVSVVDISATQNQVRVIENYANLQ